MIQLARLTYSPLLIALGGSVAKLLLQYPDQYTVRCLTRNPSSEKAKALSTLGGEVAKADLTDPSTLPKAFKKVWGVFAVTDFYDTVFHPLLLTTKSLTEGS